MTLQVVITEDGSTTLFIPELNEHYHSIHGAIQESMHIFIREGYKQIRNFPARIFEAGFGTGLNAFLTYLVSEKEGKSIHYTAIEKYPLEDHFVSLMNYPEKTDPAKEKVFHTIHDASWEQDILISEHFTLHKMQGDLRMVQMQDKSNDLVFFDAFGPDVQPELWIEEIFRMLCQSMKEGAILVTYSSKGSVIRALNAAGFSLEKLPGPPGKREMTRATKKN
ncbi:MAG: tRNA (5-methylaminomethyl-2-thiouridine)(34)-methyltransferase MnmD [Bacteroidales bacterium]|jgi:tRNA U34 5-methylaminomethyl-2-thiouridine-forming methyltransferase MnmC